MTISTLPMAPFATRFFSAEKFGSKRRLKPIISGVPAASTTFRHFSTRLEARSTGFSQNTALPAFAPASIRSACVSVGVPIRIASMSPAATIAFGVAHLRAGRLGERRRGLPVDVGDRDQRRVRRGGDVAPVDLADAPGAEQPETKHAFPPTIESD